MSNGIGKLTWGDIKRGIAVAVLGPLFVSIVAALGSIILAPGFDVLSVDWTSLGRSLLNISIVSAYGGFSGYISKQLLTDNQGNILGIGSE